MQIVYENSLDDLVAFSNYHVAHSPTIQRSLALIRWGGTGAVFAIIFGAGLLGDHLVVYSVAAAVTALVVFLWFPRAFRRNHEKQLRGFYSEGKNRGILGRHTLILEDAGLVERTETGQQRTAWEAVERVASTESHSFVYISAVQAHVIPRAAVVEGDYDSFVAALQERQSSEAT